MSTTAVRFSRENSLLSRALSLLGLSPALLLTCLFFSATSADGADSSALQSAVNGIAGANGTVNVSTGGFIFSGTSPAVNIRPPRTNLTIKGNTSPSNFSSSVNALLDGIDRINTPSATLATDIGNKVTPFASSLPALAFIAGNGPRSVTSGSATAFDPAKLLNITTVYNATFPNGTPGNPTQEGLNLDNLRFTDVTVDYTFTYTGGGNNGAGGVTNGLVGNFSGNSRDVSMGDLTGNAFTNVNVALHGYTDTHYLAGGGVIGLRATGEGSATSASASMNAVSGNIFSAINVITDHASAASGSGSAYIEGGGIIGVDAVSSPAKKNGHASIDDLSNNLFTSVTVRSDDVILGGGLVGLNNNSQNSNNDTYARLTSAKGNIFGNGSTGDIMVEMKYSLRGGGVIGLNGLSNASVQLYDLSDNTFAGVKVTSTDSYIKGGGIVGLQSNDGGEGKPLDPGDEQDDMQTVLGSASGNLFVNTQVSAGTYLDGGGIIGLRANKGTVVLNDLQGNVFKGLAVETRGILGNGYLHGGGVVGLSSARWVDLGSADGNYFDDIEVTVAGSELQGGGIIGVSASLADQGGYAASLGSLTNNTFTGLNTTVNNGDITGGGIVGAHAGSGPAYMQRLSGNTFDTLAVTSQNLSGGGVIGLNAATGEAILDWVTEGNSFAAPSVTVTGALSGGGVIGLNAGENASLIEMSGTNAITGANIEAGSLSGGGVIGLNAGENPRLSPCRTIKTLRIHRLRSAALFPAAVLSGSIPPMGQPLSARLAATPLRARASRPAIFPAAACLGLIPPKTRLRSPPSRETTP
jgi:hypothetical protein